MPLAATKCQAPCGDTTKPRAVGPASASASLFASSGCSEVAETSWAKESASSTSVESSALSMAFPSTSAFPRGVFISAS